MKNYTEKLQEELLHVKGNINYPYEQIAQYFDDALVTHLGYVDVQEVLFGEEVRYMVVGIDKELPLLSRQDDNSEDTFHCLVWQQSSSDTEYFGYLCFPLKDGRYWAVSYENKPE